MTLIGIALGVLAVVPVLLILFGWTAPLTSVGQLFGGGFATLSADRIAIVVLGLLILVKWVLGSASTGFRLREAHMAKALVENVVEINKPPAVVFDYASDHIHEPEWNPAMRSVRKLSDGPAGLGTRYEMEFAPGRPMVAICDRFDPPRRWEVTGKALGMDVTLGGEVTPTAAGSHLVFRTEFRGSGFRNLVVLMIRRRWAPVMQRNVEQIKSILEGAQ